MDSILIKKSLRKCQIKGSINELGVRSENGSYSGRDCVYNHYSD